MSNNTFIETGLKISKKSVGSLREIMLKVLLRSLGAVHLAYFPDLFKGGRIQDGV